MLVRTFMTTPVIALSEELTCRDALRLFQEQKIRRAPVLREKRLLGIVSDRDLMRALPGSVLALDTPEGQLAETQNVGAIMTRDPHTATPDMHIEDAAASLLRHKIGALPVVEAGEVIGIVTESDLFRALIQVIGGTEGVRLTLLPPPAGVASGHNDNIALLCLRLSLRLELLLTHSTPGGKKMVQIRAVGARVRDLPVVLADAGFAVVECLFHDTQT
jgi:CBS domain-containing protein